MIDWIALNKLVTTSGNFDSTVAERENECLETGINVEFIEDARHMVACRIDADLQPHRDLFVI